MSWLAAQKKASPRLLPRQLFFPEPEVEEGVGMSQEQETATERLGDPLFIFTQPEMVERAVLKGRRQVYSVIGRMGEEGEDG